MDYNGQDNGFIGSVLTIVSILGTCLSFLFTHTAIITVPSSVIAAIYAIRYYRAATAYYNNKKKDDDRHDKISRSN